MRVLAIATLLLSGAALLFVGWTGLTAPQELMDPLGVPLASIDARNEMRAAYGGMHAALGLFFVVAALRTGLRTVGLWVALCFMGGLVAGRTVSAFVDGMPGPFVLRLWAVEALATLAAAIALGSGRRRRGARR